MTINERNQKGDVSMTNAPSRQDGSLAIVTGAARGIGAAIAGRFSDAGYAVALWDFNGDGAEEEAARFRAQGRKAISAKVDVADDRAVTNLETGRLSDRHPPFRYAALARVWPAVDLPAATLQRVDEEFFETHLRLDGTMLIGVSGHGQNPRSTT